MDAEKRSNEEVGSVLSDNSGQSVVEFLVLLPLLIGVTMFLLRSNMALQSAIVNQKYARAQTLYLAMNSAQYPRNEHTSNMTESGMNRMILGVANNIAPDDGTEYAPEAQTQSVLFKQSQRGNEDPQTEPTRRSTVRIRNTVTLCTQSNFVTLGGARMSATQMRDGANLRFCEGGGGGV